MANDSVDGSPDGDHPLALRRHPKYWLDDGSLIVRTQNDMYKVHRTLLHRHSSVLSSLAGSASQPQNRICKQTAIDGCPIVHVPDELGVDSADFEALLEHLYHDV